MRQVAAPTRRVELRVSHVWRNEVMSDAVMTVPGPVTLGASDRATFTIPDLGLPPDFAIIRPGARGYVLTLGEGMGGRISIDDATIDVREFVSANATSGFCATPVGPADWGVVELDRTGEHVLFFQFVAASPPLPLAHWRDAELLAPAFAFAVIIHAIFLAASYQLDDGSNALVFPGRANLMTTYLVERPAPEPPPEESKGPAADKDGDKKDVKSSTKGKEGKAGGEGEKRAKDPNVKDEEIDPDLQKGALSDKSRKALEETIHTNIDTTLARMNAMTFGEKQDGDRGQGKGTGFGFGDFPGGTGTKSDSTGRGRGGGGNVDKDFVSHGKIDAGESRAPKGDGGDGSAVKENGVVATGNASGDLGGLTREEIDRIVKSRAGLIRACYQRELNKTRGLGGKLVVRFSIDGAGKVKSSSIDGKSVLRNAEVESCVKRQIMKLEFPAKGSGAVVNYPFIFSQG